VAGLQAIATAHRLGAVVTAFDTRPEVGEQVRSLGARFLKLELGETSGTAAGYAKSLTASQLELLQARLVPACRDAHVVITTAQVFGRKAPLLVTADAVSAMAPGSVIVDVAAETGGNVEGTVAGETVRRNGVTLIGWTRLPARVPATASQALAANFTSFINEFWNRKTRVLEFPPDDEIIRGGLVTHGGTICHPLIRERLGAAGAGTTPP
jgi:NAD(P) transhydrogenase subunit alpha